MAKYSVTLRHTETASRLIFWEHDAETDARSILDICEAKNDYAVVRMFCGYIRRYSVENELYTPDKNGDAVRIENLPPTKRSAIIKIVSILVPGAVLK